MHIYMQYKYGVGIYGV